MTGKPGIWLELCLDRESMAGWLHDGEHAPRALSGWLELVGALEELHARVKERGSAAEPSRRGEGLGGS